MSSIEILESFFDRKKASQPGYSLRAFARDLGVSPAFASLVMKGKKRLPLRLVDRAVRVLDVDMESAYKLKQEYVPEEILRSHRLLDRQFMNNHADWVLQERQKLKALRHWFYIAILDLTTCADYDGTVEQIARRLGLALPTVEVALRELVELGLLVEKDGRLVKTTKDMRLAASQSQADIRRFHSQLLDKAKEEMSEKTSSEDFSRRLITGITIAANPEKIEAAKKMLSECLHEIAVLLKDGHSTEVYHLSAQLFPLTQPETQAES